MRRPGRVELRILDGPEAPRTIRLDAPIITVGRSVLADVCVRERSVSSVHFELRATAEGASLRDLDSTNGVWFGGRRIRHMELFVGDRFRAGSCRFELVGVEQVEVPVAVADNYGRLYGQSVAMRELYADLDKLGPDPPRRALARRDRDRQGAHGPDSP